MDLASRARARGRSKFVGLLLVPIPTTIPSCTPLAIPHLIPETAYYTAFDDSHDKEILVRQKENVGETNQTVCIVVSK